MVEASMVEVRDEFAEIVTLFRSGPSVRGWTDRPQADLFVVTATGAGTEAEAGAGAGAGTRDSRTADGGVRWHWTAAEVDEVCAKVTAERFAADGAKQPLLRAEELLLEGLLT